MGTSSKEKLLYLACQLSEFDIFRPLTAHETLSVANEILNFSSDEPEIVTHNLMQFLQVDSENRDLKLRVYKSLTDLLVRF